MNNEILDTLAVFTEAFEQVDISEDELLEISSKIDFIHLFSDVKDFRQQWKVTYKLSNLLFLIFLVKLEERTNSFMEIAAYIKIREKKYSEYGLIEDGKCPSHDTIRRVMMLLDQESLYNETIDRFYQFLTELEREVSRKKYRHLAVDGKCVNGTGRGEATKKPSGNHQLLNIYDSGLATCIHCEQIDSKTNEIPVAQELLRKMNLKKTVVTADALHCQRETASTIHQQRGVYVLTVKDNQSSLLEEIITRMEKNEKKIRIHDRDKRRIEILFLPQSYATDGFLGMKSFVKMTSGSGKRHIVRYFISNTKNEELICEAIEARWLIENGLHKEKDTFLYEDRITYTNKNAVKNMAVLNNLAVQLFRLYQAVIEPDFYMAKRTVHAYPVESLQKMLDVLDSEAIMKKFKSALKKKK